MVEINLIFLEKTMFTDILLFFIFLILAFFGEYVIIILKAKNKLEGYFYY